MPESEGSESQFTQLPDQSGLYGLIQNIRETKKIEGVLSSGEEAADMITKFIPEIFRFIQTNYPDTRQETLKADVNAGNLKTLKELAFEIRKAKSEALLSKGQNPKKDISLRRYDTIWRVLDGFVRRPTIPSGFERALKGANLNPQGK